MSPETQLKLLHVVLHLGSIVVGLSFAMIYLPTPDGVAAALSSLAGKIMLGLGALVLALTVWRLLNQYKRVAPVRSSPLLWAVVLLALAAVVAVLVWWTGSPMSEASTLAKIGGTLLAGVLAGASFGIMLHASTHILAAKQASTNRHRG